VNNVSQMTISVSAVDLQTNNLLMGNSTTIQWAGSVNRRIFNDTAGFIFEVEASDTFIWQTQNTTQLTLSSAALTLGNGNNILMGASGAFGFIEQGALTTPATPADGFGRLYVKEVATVTTPFFIGDDGTEIDLTTGGGGEFTAAWTADHNQGGSAFGLRDALFVDPTVTTKKLQIDLAGMTASVTAILDFNFTTAKTITFPDTTGTVALTSDLTGFFDTAGTGLTSTGSTVNVIGTASRIVANANDIDIDSAYVGQTSITTLGTIGTGTWEGTVVASAFLDADTMHLSVSQTVTSNKIFQDNVFFIQNPAATFEYQFLGAAIAASRTLTLPLLTGNDTMVTEAHIQTLTNKTMDGDLNTFVDINETQMNVSVGAATTVLTSNGVGSAPTYAAPAGGEFTAAWTADHNQGGSAFGLRDALFVDPTVTTKKIQMDLAGMTAAVTAILDFNFTTAKTITFPDTTGTVALTSDLTGFFDTAGTGLTSTGSTVNVIGTTDRIVANANDIDIASGYVGQASITTLGTIGTGTWQGDVVASAFLDADTMHLSVAQVVTATKTFADNALLIQNPAADGNDYLFQSAAIVADRTITLPLLTGNDTMVTEAFAATLTNKTINTASNTITVVAADMTDYASATATFTNKTIDADGTGNVLTNIGSSEVKSELITGFGTVTAASGDFVLISDTTDSGNLKKIDAVDFLGGTTLPVVDTTSIAEGSADATKEVRFEVDGNTTGIIGVLATIFTTAKTVTFPDATDTLMGKATTDVMTNKTFDLDANTLTGTAAEFNTALQAETFFFISNNISNMATSTSAQFDAANSDGTFFLNADNLSNMATSTFAQLNAAISDATIVDLDDAQVLTNKTIDGDDNTIIDINETQMNVSVGAATTVLTSNGVGSAPTYAAPAGGEFTAAWTADHNQGGSTFGLRDALFVDPTVTTKKLQIDLVGMTAAITATLDFNFTTAKTITFPDATDTLMGKATTDVMTNKSLDANGTGNVITNIGDAEIEAHTSTKITIIAKGQLNSNIVYTDQANTFGAFDTSFQDLRLQINNPANTFQYIFDTNAILADRNVILPVLTGDDTFVFNAFAATLTNKTINTASNTITVVAADMTDYASATATFTNKTIDADGTGNVLTNIGSSEIKSEIITGQATVTAITGDFVLFSDTSDSGNLKKADVADFLGGGEVFTWTADHDAAGFDLLNVGGIQINNPADTFQYIITPAAIVADRILNLPLMTGTDTLVLEAFAAVLTNKTINADDNTINQSTPAAGEFLRDNGTSFVPSDIQGGDLPDTISGTHIFNGLTTFNATVSFDSAAEFLNAGLQIRNPADTFEYVFNTSAIVANRIVNLPLLTATDTFVFEAFAQTLTNKTLDADGTGNVITNIGSSEIKSEMITGFGTETPVSGDFVLFSDTSDSGNLKKADANDFLGGGGEVFTWTADHSAGSFDLTTLGNLLMTADETHLIDLTRTTAQADDYTIGELRFRHPDGVAALQNYARITGVMEDDTDTSEDGSLHFFVTQAGGHDVEFMNFNDGANTLINILKTMNFNSGGNIIWAANSNRQILNNTNGFQFNVDTSDNFKWIIVSTDELTLTSTTLNLEGNILQFADVNTTITQVTNDLEYDVALGEEHRWRINDITELTLDGGGMTLATGVFNMSNGTLGMGSGIIQFDTLNTTITAVTADLEYDVATGNSHRFRVNNAPEYEFDSATADFNANTLTDVGGITTTAGATVTITGTGATGFIDIDEITTPASPAANTVRLHAKDVGGNTHIFQDNSTESPIDLTTGGVAGATIELDNLGTTAVNATINMGSNLLTFGDANTSITGVTNDLEYDVATGEEHRFRINGVNQLRIIANQFIIEGSDIQIPSNGTIAWDGNANRRISNLTSGFQFEVETSDTFDFFVQNVSEMILNATTLDLQTNTITDVGGITTTAGATINVIGTGATGFIDIDEITTPASPTANTVRLHAKDVGGNTHIFQDNSTESPIDLTTGSEVTTWTANHDAAGFNLLNLNELEIENIAGDFQYTITGAAIVADRIITLPLLTGNDIMVTEAFAQTLTNKTIDGDLNTIIDINETQMNVSVGASTTVLTSNGVGSAPTYQAPAGGEFTAAWTADHNQGGSAFGLQDALFVDPTVTTKKVQIDLVGMTAAVTAILDFNFTTAKTLTFPDATDTLMGKATTDVMTNKSYDLGGAGNVLTGSTTEFNTALQSDTFFFISNNISNMATSTSAQFDAANSDGTFFLNGDNISAMATSTAAQFDTANSDENFAYEGQANTWGTDNQNIAATGEWQEGGVAISPIGIHDIPINATGMYATTTLPATGLTQTELPTNDVDIQTWDFTSTTADERVQFSTPLPRNYNNGAITVSFTWSQSSGTGNVVWRVGAVAAGQSENIDQAFVFSADVTDAAGTANQYQQFTTASFTPGGTPADANQMHFEVMRQGSDASDTFTGTARLHSVVIHMTTDTATAA